MTSLRSIRCYATALGTISLSRLFVNIAMLSLAMPRLLPRKLRLRARSKGYQRSQETSLYSLCVVLSVLPAALGHMMIDWPTPMRSKYDAYMVQHNPNLIDYSYTDPLDADGSNFPCKGYQTVSDPSVTSYRAGQTYNVSITGGAVHNGGTCQLAISIDGGPTLKVIKSMIGGCPLEPSYDFTLPSYTPSKLGAILSWSWINHSGNREFCSCIHCSPRHTDR